MAAIHTQVPLVSRPRPARVPAANAAPSASQTPIQISLIASNVSLFLTSLRLLDLDLLSDWPDINLLTFTTKDAAQGQKKRIQCVEWALYQLFVLWDPDEARNKLKPFFPPLDQLQSANLRAALLRSLEQLKKNGVLGRDAILRKTMLDECKGERLEEILAVFSSAVLKKMVGEQKLNSKTCPAVARTLALEKRGFKGERAELDTLILAHKVSIRKKLDRQAAFRTRYKGLATLLDVKEQRISNRREHARSIAGSSHIVRLSGDDKSRIRRAVTNNWAGNEQWQEALISGDSNTHRDGVLNVPFDRVWKRTRSDLLSEFNDKGGRLVDQLDSRMRAQQESLRKWQKFRSDVFDDISDQCQNKSSGELGQHRGIDLVFGVHESLDLGCMGSSKLTGSKAAMVGSESCSFLQNMEMELANATKVPKTRASGCLRGRQRLATIPSEPAPTPRQKAADEPVSELSELEDEPEASVPTLDEPFGLSSRQDLVEAAASATGSRQSQRSPRQRLPQPLSSMHAFLPKPQSSEISPTEPHIPRPPPKLRVPSPRPSSIRQGHNTSHSPTPSPTRSIPPSLSLSSPRNSPPRRTQSPEELPPSSTQQQADQILASMSAASPSPVKQPRPRHTLSLAERTRLSMVRGGSIHLDDEDEIGISSPIRLGRRATSSRSPTKRKPAMPTTMTEETLVLQVAEATAIMTTEGDDLVARTRRSMANFETAQERARLERQRSERRAARQRTGSIARQNYFPSVDEDGDAAGDGNSGVVLEQLMAKEAESAGADYESVFKSRPKIKTSPPATPARGDFEWE